MARASTPLELNNSPSARRWAKSSNKDVNSLRKSVFRPPPHAEKGRSHRSPFRFRPLRQSPYKRPVLAPKSKLATIREESPEKNCIGKRSAIDSNNNAISPEFELLEDFSDRLANESSSSVSDYEGWDDEETLVARFQDVHWATVALSASETPDREKVADLAYQLEGPMQAQAESLKHYLAHNIAPAARKVKEVHNSLEQKVDVSFGVSVLSFDDACKKVEQLSLSNEDDLRQAYIDAQHNVRELFQQLKEAFQKREQLWSDLRDAIDKSADQALFSLNNIPTELDDTISVIDKKAKDITKSSGMDGKAKQKLLRDLLSEY